MHSTVEGKYHWIRYWYHGLQLVSIDAYCLNISYLNWLLAMMVCNWLVLVLTHLLREALVRWLEMLISLSSNYSAYLLRPSVTFFFFVQTSFIFFKFVSQHTWLGSCLSCLQFLAVWLFCIHKKSGAWNIFLLLTWCCILFFAGLPLKRKVSLQRKRSIVIVETQNV